MREEKIPNPSGTELRKALESVQQATNEEAIEKIRRGLTLEPEARRVPRDVHDVGVSPIQKGKRIPNPSNTELRETLELIRQATNEEAIERIKRGLTLEPEARRVPRDVHDVGVSPVEKEKGLDLDGYIKKWQSVNKSYLPNNIDLGETKIENTPNVDIPFDFTDYLIGKARTLMAEKDSDTLENIKQIKIRFRPGDKELVFLTRNDSNKIAVLSFQIEPPFSLIRANSDLGIFTF